MNRMGTNFHGGGTRLTMNEQFARSAAKFDASDRDRATLIHHFFLLPCNSRPPLRLTGDNDASNSVLPTMQEMEESRGKRGERKKKKKKIIEPVPLRPSILGTPLSSELERARRNARPRIANGLLVYRFHESIMFVPSVEQDGKRVSCVPCVFRSNNLQRLRIVL